MAPSSYRNQNRRQNRTGYVDHDVFEGLPVRQWRRDFVTVAPPPTQESAASQNDIWAVELPHGMPKDSHLLPQHSQDLLRAARSGRIYKRSTPVEEEEADVEAILGDKSEKKDDDPKDRGFTAKAWKQIPRHMEGPDIEYLAKRRKGLITSTKAANPLSTLTKATVKRIDAAGNEYVQDVVVPQGQPVEGEVIAQAIIPDPNASATSDGLPVQPTPPRRKGPPPRRKPKGPGRGRKKKQIAPTSAPQVINGDGSAQAVERGETIAGADRTKFENENESETLFAIEDTDMADGSMLASDDEEGEEGEEGEDGDDDDEGSVDNQSSPSKPPRSSSPTPSKLLPLNAVAAADNLEIDMSSVAPTAAPRLSNEGRLLETKTGSPLKQLALTTSTLTSPLASPTVPAPVPLPADFQGAGQLAGAGAPPININEAMQQDTSTTAPTALSPSPPEPRSTEVADAVEVRREEEQEEEMLLDIVENANNAAIGRNEISSITPPAVEPEIHSFETTPLETVGALPEEDFAHGTAQSEKVKQQTIMEEDDDDDDFPDLLGGLEQQLNEPAIQNPVPSKASKEIEDPIETELQNVDVGKQ